MSRFSYTLHNIVGHPLMEIASIFGFHKLAGWLHNVTLPKNWQDDTDPHDDPYDAGEVS